MNCGQIAQLVEQRIENPRVGGSIPSLATMLLLKIILIVLISLSFNLMHRSAVDHAEDHKTF